MARKNLRLLIVLGTMLCVPAYGQQSSYLRFDQSWATLDGTVVAVKKDSFLLDYGEGVITVEMDDWDWFREGSLISSGDQVTVSGLVDADLLERRSIEAKSVYVDDLNTYYYASAADEEIDPYVASATYGRRVLDDDSQITLTGTVASIEGREFTLDTGSGTIQVDTLGMGYNPLDNMGFQRISPGDKVSINGQLDLDFFEDREIDADSILSLEHDAGKSNASG